MFQRIQYDEGHLLFALIGFLLFFTLFILLLLRLNRMPKKKIDQMSSLPLENDEHHKSL